MRGLVSISVVVLFFFLCSRFLIAQSVDFFREYIEIEIKPPLCSVTGDYYFKNNTSLPLDRTICYPFVISKSISYPCDIKITNMNDSTDIAYAKSDSAALFRLHLEPKSITRVKVVFTQMTKAQQFEYILTTTQKWGKPLDRAVYCILHSPGIELEIPYPQLFEKTLLNGKINYYIECKSFMPHSDLIIYWKKKK